jgi:ribosomal protein S25
LPNVHACPGPGQQQIFSEIIRLMKSRPTKWTVYAARMEDMRNIQLLSRKTYEKVSKGFHNDLIVTKYNLFSRNLKKI